MEESDDDNNPPQSSIDWNNIIQFKLYKSHIVKVNFWDSCPLSLDPELVAYKANVIYIRKLLNL